MKNIKGILNRSIEILRHEHSKKTSNPSQNPIN